MPNPTVKVLNLKKYYQVHQKEPGLWGSVKSLFHRKYYNTRAVDGISFNIEEGELVGFIGPNGAGKTTTLKCLSGLLYPTSGEVKVLGFTPHERKNQFLSQISLVMGQKNQLWWDLPPIDSFTFCKEIYGISDSEYKRVLDELTTLLEVKELLNVQVKKLSLGQRMKMELIAALIHSPKILFLDEPTIGLDVVMQKKIRDFIKEYNQKYKATIILTSHYMEDVKQLAKRVIIIDLGRILFDGRLDSIISKFSTNKTIKIKFEKDVSKKSLEKFGDVEFVDGDRATLIIKRQDASEITSQLLKEYSVEDLTIEESSIEEIIREVFSQKNA